MSEGAATGGDKVGDGAAVGAAPEGENVSEGAAVGTAPGAGAAAFSTGTLLAALIAIPAALRAQGSSTPLVWLVLAGAGALACGGVSAAISSLRAEKRAFFVLGLALGLTLPVLAVFGRILKNATHHRALGGVTFAVVAALMVLGAIWVCHRLVDWADTSLKQKVIAAIGILGGLAGARFCLPLLTASAARTAVLDGVLLLAATLAAALWVPHAALKNRKLGLGLWLSLSCAAVVVLLAVPAARQAARDAAPVLFGPFWLI